MGHDDIIIIILLICPILLLFDFFFPIFDLGRGVSNITIIIATSSSQIE